MTDQPEQDGICLKGFTSSSHRGELESYISALESFNRLEQLQELKKLGHEHIGISGGARVLEVGCGFGLETLRLFGFAKPGGFVAGCDLSSDFLVEARHRASAVGANIVLARARAEALPYADKSFDVLWCERVLIYVPDTRRAISEMRRVLRVGGRVALVEPDISTSTLNVQDRALLRRVMGHEADRNVSHSWLPGQLQWMLQDVAFTDIRVATRVVVFAPELAATYFTECGRSAARDAVISDSELEAWTAEIRGLHNDRKLFATVGYFLFTARAPAS